MTKSDDANLRGRGLLANPGYVRVSIPGTVRSSRAWTDDAADVLDPVRAAVAREDMRAWPTYSSTPLRSLPTLAERLGVAEVRCKDESDRFGIGSFKALGGAYAVLRVLQDEVERMTGSRPEREALLAGEVVEARSITTVTASAGNHGRSVAWGSALFGCRCVVVLPKGAAPARAAAIESHDAIVEWYPGEYDAAVLHVEELAAERGWLVVSDTAYEGYEEIPRRVSEGYTLLADEVIEAFAEESAATPTHLFIQAGVGGLATGTCGHLWSQLGDDRPDMIAVEPLSADCFARSIRAGELRSVAGPFDTHMGGLASGVPSPLAWKLLGGCLDGAIAIDDRASDIAAGALADGRLGAEIVAGPSGAAGVAALLALTRLPSARRLLRLDSLSRVLVLVTETQF